LFPLRGRRLRIVDKHRSRILMLPDAMSILAVAQCALGKVEDGMRNVEIFFLRPVAERLFCQDRSGVPRPARNER